MTGCRWLMYSHHLFNIEDLRQEISRCINVEIGLKWKVIPLGKKGYEKDAPRALNVEVDESDYNKVKRALNNWLRSREVSFYPLGIKVRWFPEWRELNNGQKSVKVLAKRQKYFTKNLVMETVTYLMS